MSHLLIQYSYLQILDFLTTITFLVYGIREANPFVRWAIQTTESPVGGLLLVKCIAILLGIVVWKMGRRRLLARINVMFALLVTWNLVALILGAMQLA